MKQLILETQIDKPTMIRTMVDYTVSLGLQIIEQNIEKPWGAYFRFDEKNIDIFIQEFFSDVRVEKNGLLTPKILVLAPHGVLSWQYHNRRSELWKVLLGPMDIIHSTTDDLTPPVRKYAGDIIQHDKLIRHRLIATDVWGAFAEIWQHTDPANPSTEEDIVRIQDQYGR